MRSVVETPPYLHSAKAAGISDSVRAEIVSAVGTNPLMGELVVGAGGLRKFRFSRPGEGKSGGFRILSVYLGEHLPVFLIGAFAKNQRANISAADRSQIAKRLKSLAETYRK
jgi:hypothetical protein